MSEKKKYYWLKLKRDFFKRHDIRIVESMLNGKDYILFYLKLLLESIDHEGTLRFSETIPYNEQMLSVVTNTNIDTVRSAMKLFIELNMMTVCDDQTIYMNEVDKLIGSETNWARQKREQRLGVDNVHQLSTSCPPEIDKDKEIDIDTELEEEEENISDHEVKTHATAPTLDDIVKYCKLKNYNFAQKFYSYYQSVHWLDKNGKPIDWRSKADYWKACDDEKPLKYEKNGRIKPDYNFDPEEAFKMAVERSNNSFGIGLTTKSQEDDI